MSAGKDAFTKDQIEKDEAENRIQLKLEILAALREYSDVLVHQLIPGDKRNVKLHTTIAIEKCLETIYAKAAERSAHFRL